MLFDAHTRCLTGLGGVAGRGIYDNMKTAVDRTPRKDRGRVVNARFAAMAAHYLFEPDFCNVASGWEKGRVEKSVQDTRRRIWQEAQHAALRQLRRAQCLAGDAVPGRVGRRRIRSCTGMTIREAWTQERAAADADADAVRRLRRSAGPRVEHQPGQRRAQSLLGAVRLGRPPRQRAAVSGAGRHRRRPARGRRARARRRIATTSSTTGSTTCRWSSASPAPCATARRLPTCPTRCSGCAAPCCGTTAATRSWPGC